MNNCYNLDFFENPLKSNFIYPEASTSLKFDDARVSRVWNYRDQELLDMLNPDIIKWTKKNNLKFESLYLFLTMPNFRTVIHTDSSQLGYNPIVINWVKDSIPDSYTIWYKPRDELGVELSECVDHQYNSIYYLKMDESKMVEVERHRITNPSLIRVDVPHQAVNESDQLRWTISLRFHNYIGEWANIVECFSPYIKND